jgi:hypothetical protein
MCISQQIRISLEHRCSSPEFESPPKPPATSMYSTVAWWIAKLRCHKAVYVLVTRSKKTYRIYRTASGGITTGTDNLFQTVKYSLRIGQLLLIP